MGSLVPGLAVSIQEDVIVLHLQNELTALHQSKDLPELVEKYLSEDYRRFVFNLSDVGYLDSSGLGIFFGLYKRIDRAGGRMILAEVPERIRRVFEMMNFHALVRFADSVDEAVQEVRRM